jgi:biotin carboxyl carrier protein
VRHPAVIAGDVSTGFIEEYFTPALDEALPAEALEAAARFAASEIAADPWRGRWRAGALRPPPTREVARADDGSLHVWHDGRSLRVPRGDLAGVAELARRPAGGGDAEHARLTAPMPGTVLRIEVAEGDEVAAQQTLLVLEAMKMEQPVAAPFDGRVERLSCQVGATVRTGDVLVELTSA